MTAQKLLTSLAVIVVAFAVIGIESASTQDFKSVKAKSALLEYREALRRARTSYLKDLETASSIAIRKDDLDEALAIKKEIASVKEEHAASIPDALVKTRRAIEGSVFTWNRRGDPDQLRFSKNGLVTAQKGSEGIWQVLEPDVIVIKFQQNLFLLKFDERLTQFRVAAFGPVPTGYKVGNRVAS